MTALTQLTEAMGPLETLSLYSVAIVAVSLFGGSLPLIRRWSSGQLHLFTGLSAGFFISAAFLALIPESIELMGPHDASAMVMVGLVAALLMERVMFTHHRTHHPKEGIDLDGHRHLLTSITAFLGLTVHCVMEGLALGMAVLSSPEMGAMVFAAIIAHEGFEVMALATTFRLAGISTARSTALVMSYSLLAPVTAFSAVLLFDMLESAEAGPLMALAAGTFLYVGICDLLPEAFREGRKGLRALLMVVIGIMVMYVITMMV